MAAAASDHEQKRLKLEEALQDDRVELVNLPTSLLEEMTDVSQDVELVGEGGNGIVYKTWAGQSTMSKCRQRLGMGWLQ